MLMACDPGTPRGADLVVNLHGCGPQSHRALFGLGGDRLLAYRCPGTWSDGPDWSEEESERERWCRLLRWAGIPADPARVHLRRPTIPAPRSGAIVLHLGAASPERRWPASSFASLVKDLPTRSVVLTGLAEERSAAEQVIETAGLDPAADLTGRLGLVELAALVSSARLVVSGDTGMAHLAVAYGIPSVTIFGAASPVTLGSATSEATSGPSGLDGETLRQLPTCRSRTWRSRSASCWRRSRLHDRGACPRPDEGYLMRVLGINAIFHDPAAALVVDGEIVAAAEEERFSRRKHGKRPVPFSAWELPELSMRWCLREAGSAPQDLDAVAYSFDPALAKPVEGRPLGLASADVRRARRRSSLPPRCRASIRSESASCRTTWRTPPRPRWPPRWATAACWSSTAGARARRTWPAGTAAALEVLAQQQLPHTLGLLYESLTEHLGFLRSSDEYKVMALASYGTPRHLDELRELVHADGDGGFVAEPLDWTRWAPRRDPDSTSPRTPGAARTPTWPPRCRCGWRRCWWSWPAGCTRRPVTGC